MTEYYGGTLDDLHPDRNQVINEALERFEQGIPTKADMFCLWADVVLSIEFGIRDRVRACERILHKLASNYSFMNHGGVKEILNKISDWDRAHRAGNGYGELSDEELEDRIDEAFWRMCE